MGFVFTPLNERQRRNGKTYDKERVLRLNGQKHGTINGRMLLKRGFSFGKKGYHRGTVTGGHKIGKLEKDGNVWYWEAYDTDGSVAAGWTYEKDKAITKCMR